MEDGRDGRQEIGERREIGDGREMVDKEIGEKWEMGGKIWDVRGEERRKDAGGWRLQAGDALVAYTRLRLRMSCWPNTRLYIASPSRLPPCPRLWGMLGGGLGRDGRLYG